jgi:hypothetical protein
VPVNLTELRRELLQLRDMLAGVDEDDDAAELGDA